MRGESQEAVQRRPISKAPLNTGCVVERDQRFFYRAVIHECIRQGSARPCDCFEVADLRVETERVSEWSQILPRGTFLKNGSNEVCLRLLGPGTQRARSGLHPVEQLAGVLAVVAPDGLSLHRVKAELLGEWRRKPPQAPDECELRL